MNSALCIQTHKRTGGTLRTAFDKANKRSKTIGRNGKETLGKDGL